LCEGGKVSRDLNKVILIGNLGRDPEMRNTPAGRPVTSFTVATNRSWNTADGEHHSDTEWFNIVAWGNLAEICKQHLSKGKQVYIEGRFQTRRWDDKEGNKHTTTEVVASEMIMLGEHRSANHDQGNETGGAEIENRVEEDDFPF
jgi:single-strand DNA-binding protein